MRQINKKNHPLVVIRQLSELYRVFKILESENSDVINRTDTDYLLSFVDKTDPKFFFDVTDVTQTKEASVKFRVKYAPNDPNHILPINVLISADKVFETFITGLNF